MGEAQNLGTQAHFGFEVREPARSLVIGRLLPRLVECDAMVASPNYIFEILSGSRSAT